MASRSPNEEPRRRRRRLVIAVALALALRAWAALLLPVDFDEPVYVAAALDYAAALRAGDLGAVATYTGNAEHPPLVKLIYAGGALALGDGANAESVRYTSRAISVLAGTLAVGALGVFFGPLAAVLLAIHTLAVKYTSQAYLEAVPLLTMIVALGAARAAVQANPDTPSARRWLWVSAAALGLTAAGKLTYALVLPGIVALLLGGRVRPRALVGYALLAALVFWAATPTLWRDPLGGLAGLAGFHLAYSQRTDVAAAAYPWYQPLIWLATSAAAGWHPDVFFYFGFDGLIFLLALGGLSLAWRSGEGRWAVIWLGVGVLVLLLWRTKWPQYALPLIPAVCVLAGLALARLIAYLRELDAYWGYSDEMLPHPPRYAWVALGLAVTFVLGIYMYGFAAAALGGVGWSRLMPGQGRLPPGPVSDVLALPDGRMALATARGVLLWGPPVGGDPSWEEPAGASAALAGGPALALAHDTAGRLWVGGGGGLVSLDPAGARSYDAEELGGSALVRALAADAAGRLWVGTGAGAAVRESDGSWTPLPGAARGGLVLSVAVQERPGGPVVWFGGDGVLSRLDVATGAWSHFGREHGFGEAGVSDLLVDVEGHVWAATLGDGLGRWDGNTWHWRRPGDGLPTGTLTALAEGPPGTLWVGSAASLSAGGAVTRLRGDELYTYLPRNSGYNAAEPLAMTFASDGRLWIGTRVDGVFTYQPPE